MTDTTAPAGPVADVDEFDETKFFVQPSRRIPVALALALILFISALDSTIVAVALPKIGAEFNNYESTSWVVTAYIITYTAFLPVVSKLTDIVGRKPVLVASTLWFMAFSGACGGSKTLTELIVFRALQGIGGSAIYSGVVVTFATMVPQEIVAKYSSIIGTVFAASSVAGPLVGGAIVNKIHWGWIFYVNLPIGFVGAVVLQLTLSFPAAQPIRIADIKKRIDWLGSFLLLSSALLLALSLQLGGLPSYPWKSATVIAPLIVSLLLIPLFIYAETRHPDPILPLRLFRRTSPFSPQTHPPPNPNFPLTVLFTAFLGAALYSTTVNLPQRLQIVSSLSPISAGVRMLPLLLLTGLLSPFAAFTVIKSKSYRPLFWVCASLGAIGAGLISTLNRPDTSFSSLYGFEAIEGVSIGVTITVSTIIIQFSVPKRDLAIASGFQTFARTLGGLVGLAISTAVLNARVDSVLTKHAFPQALKTALVKSPSDVIPTLGTEEGAVAREAYAEGYALVFVLVAVWFAVGTVCTLGIKYVFPPELDPEKQNKAKEKEEGKRAEGATVAGTVTNS